MRHDFTWGEIPVCATYGAVLESAECPPPEPKLTTVSIPGGVDIDLTDALTGHAAYENRAVTLTLFFPDRDEANKALNLIHGAEADFSLSWDPGYTYHGRASVTGHTEWPGQGVRLTVQIAASPWKLREVHTESVSAVGGAKVTCRSGRRPVHPLISCDYPVTVEWEGSRFTVPAGRTYRMAAVTFTEGDNEIWLSIYSYRPASWADLAGRTWADVGRYTWAGISVADGEQDPDDFIGDGTVILQWEEAYI